MFGRVPKPVAITKTRSRRFEMKQENAWAYCDCGGDCLYTVLEYVELKEGTADYSYHSTVGYVCSEECFNLYLLRSMHGA